MVEDDATQRGSRRNGLSDAGYAVDLLDGEEGHYLGANEPYDAVVLDLGLPRSWTGSRCLRELAREGRTMPVLILTARDRWSEKVAGFDGADDYVAKPFHMEEVLTPARPGPRAGPRHRRMVCGPVHLDTRSASVGGR